MLARLSAHPRCSSLGALIGESGFGVLPPGNSYLEEGGVRFLRATELGPDNTIDWDACLRAPAKFSRHDRATLKTGDVLIAVKGATIASEKSICTVTELSEHTIINGSIFRFQPVGDTSAAFLLEVLSAPFMRQQMKGALIQNSAVDYLSKGVLDSLLFPLPRRSEQERFVAAMDAARAERRAKLAQADALLAGLDGFLLATLGLAPPPKDERKVFAVRSRETKGSRFDPYFFKPSLIKNELILSQWHGNIADIGDLLQAPPVNGVDARTYLAGGRRYLRVQNVKPFEIVTKDIAFVSGETKKDVLLQSGDVLLTRKGTFGVAAKVSDEETDCLISSEIILLRLAANARCSADFLVAWLNCSIMRAILLRRKTGAIMGHITQDVVSALRIPTPAPAVQETIATEARRRRENARRLRAEAEAGWQAAKRWFEEQLLGDAGEP